MRKSQDSPVLWFINKLQWRRDAGTPAGRARKTFFRAAAILERRPLARSSSPSPHLLHDTGALFSDVAGPLPTSSTRLLLLTRRRGEKRECSLPREASAAASDPGFLFVPVRAYVHSPHPRTSRVSPLPGSDVMLPCKRIGGVSAGVF
ncbi:hypothetical protein HPB50_016370 [Hyalomma asiaticum]|uniref:Uncharacterized protein n=1 Tax=Hyalomma asiaticum TaxID=266040 RepID=A0ACB7SMF2_HYAAI|nr:hypothetical protein HPB50_016370 [Hyalomma asiaticum]